MRASSGVSLLFASSLAIFGIYGRQRSNAAIAPGPEPVWVNGQMGIYNPDTGQFVPSTSPLFDQTCDLIQLRREQAMGHTSFGSSWGHSHHWTYYASRNVFSYPSNGANGGTYGGASAARSWDSDSAHFGSVRGGIGETGHSFGGSHS